METKITPEESWNIMQEMIASAQKNIKDDGSFYLLWGGLTVASSVAELILLHYQLSYHSLPWMIFMSIGGILSMLKSRKLKRETTVKLHLHSILQSVWAAFGFGMVLAFVGVSASHNWLLINPLIIAMYGCATFVSATVLKFDLLKYGSLGAFALAAISFFQPLEYQLIINIFAISLAYILPGLVLNKKAKVAA